PVEGAGLRLGGAGTVYRRYSADRGLTWSPRMPVYESPSPQGMPDVAIAGGHVYVAFPMAKGDASEYELLISNDAGQTFGAPVAIGNGLGSGGVGFADLVRLAA